jgi:probable F420-dependent oxidoreductase
VPSTETTAGSTVADPAIPSPRLNIALPNYGRGVDTSDLIDVAAAADAAGIHALTVVDHVVLGGDLGAYPYGAFPGGLDGPWLEPLTLLAAIAARTRKIRLTTGVVIAPLRGGAVLAKTAATLDMISGGRLDLGVGVGWLEKEYEAAGLAFSQRGRLLDDTLAICEALWAGTSTRFQSPRLQFDDIWCNPVPAQAGGVPLWIAGELHERNLARIIRHGSGWLPSPTASTDAIRAGAARLRTALAKSGRAPTSVRVRTSLPIIRDAARRPLLEPSFAAIPELLAWGATDIHTPLAQWCRDPLHARERCTTLADAWHRNVR